jgi:hypothetical protein
MNKRPKNLATPESAATIAFNPVDVSQFTKFPSLENWVQMTEKDYPIIRLAHATITKSKSELVAASRKDTAEWLAFFDSLTELLGRYEAAVKIFEAAQARMLIAMSVVAVQS